jgi:hypothetical protein
MVNTSTIINKNGNRSSPQLTQANIMTYGVDNPGPSLEQKHTCVLIMKIFFYNLDRNHHVGLLNDKCYGLRE